MFWECGPISCANTIRVGPVKTVEEWQSLFLTHVEDLGPGRHLHGAPKVHPKRTYANTDDDT